MSAPEAKRGCEMPSRLGDCQYRHDWIDGKCNTCGQIADAPEAKSQGEDESTLRLKIEELEAANAKLQEDIKIGDEMYEAQQKKYEDCPHKPLPQEYGNECGCSFDRIGDVCGLHSPALKAAKAKVAELETQLRQEREAKEEWRKDCVSETQERFALQSQVAQLQATISQLRKHLDTVQSCEECQVCRWHGYSPDEDQPLASITPKPEETK